MALKFTEDQQKVIDLRNRSILVSAAAGSGKTAVLVQRILGRVMDPEHPVDIDRILVMTFTRAAAGEMKERISRAMEKALYENPDNSHLQRQMTLIHAAQITTIDGFCSWIVRNYYHLLDLDPGFRVGDEGEMRLLKEDLIREFLTEVYARETPELQNFLECYSPNKADEGILKMILNLYEKSRSNPDPEAWLDHCLDHYKMEETDSDSYAGWMKQIVTETERQLEAAESSVRSAIKLAKEEGGPRFYLETLESDVSQIEEVLNGIKNTNHISYEELRAGILSIHFEQLKAPKKSEKEGLDESIRDAAKKLREQAKSAIRKDLQENYFQEPWENVLTIASTASAPLKTLVDLTKEFGERYAVKKRERNLMDFSDIEHMALRILRMDAQEGECTGPVGIELQRRYEEVMVDEYQDSNLVQEYITQCVCRHGSGRKNLFMVGDVKQSIYRFRLARPDLFIGKYHSFRTEDSEEQRIDLHRNFRSRHEVLDAANHIFRKIMGEDLGGITYDEAAALYPGADYYPDNGEFPVTELLMLDRTGRDPEADRLGRDEALEAEAVLCSRRIREIVGKEQIYDGEQKVMRPVQYRDIAILLRSAAGSVETFTEVLTSRGIPVYSASKSGYFSTTEVQTVLNYLRILDNPLQDIPLLGVMRSPMGGFTSEELAQMRISCPEGKLFECLRRFATPTGAASGSGSEGMPLLHKKASAFLDCYLRLREKVSGTSVNRLISEVLDQTGYGRISRALPNGAQRSANLSMLVEKAREYEKTSFRGLFNFIRYMDQLKRYEIDFGEVNLSGAGEGAVQIMTIHKSKGLEFPIVFVCGLGRQFNMQDTRQNVLYHEDMGIGADAIFPDRRLKVSSIQKKMIQNRIHEECIGEEIRVLYVALTRAREKLIMIGSAAGLGKKLTEILPAADRERELLPRSFRVKAQGYLDLILAALITHPAIRPVLDRYDLGWIENPGLVDETAKFHCEVFTAEELIPEEVLEMLSGEMEEEALRSFNKEIIWDADLREEIERRFTYEYPSLGLDEIPVKVSVSDLKKRAYQEEEQEDSSRLPSEERQEVSMMEEAGHYIPRFMKENAEEPLQGALRGTAYHRIMECLDYSRVQDDEEICRQIEEMLLQQKLSEEQADCLNRKDVIRFLETPLGSRMQEAGTQARLLREQPFMMARQARELNPEWDSDSSVLVQGIIDAYFIEGEDLVLVDYKTDQVRDAQRLVDLYKTQLTLYREALERITGKRVKETWIYSFTLGKAISL